MINMRPGNQMRIPKESVWLLDSTFLSIKKITPTSQSYSRVFRIFWSLNCKNSPTCATSTSVSGNRGRSQRFRGVSLPKRPNVWSRLGVVILRRVHRFNGKFVRFQRNALDLGGILWSSTNVRIPISFVYFLPGLEMDNFWCLVPHGLDWALRATRNKLQLGTRSEAWCLLAEIVTDTGSPTRQKLAWNGRWK